MVNTRTFISPSHKVSVLACQLCQLTPSGRHTICNLDQDYTHHRGLNQYNSKCRHAVFASQRGWPLLSLCGEHPWWAAIQPYVHDCIVEVIEDGRTHLFRVFFKNHHRLPPNSTLPARLRYFHGDILVMRAAALDPLSVVHMRERDISLADFLVLRYE